MASIIKTDNIQKVSDDSNIIKKCGSTTTVGSGSGQTIVVDGATVTLGRCGGTVSLASGATQSGFGRTGTVDWCTTAKTSPFTSESGKGYFVNTSGGAVTVTLPASPSAGDIVAINDLNGTSNTNNITLGRNGSKIDGSCIDKLISRNRQSTTVIYTGSAQGWVAVNDANVGGTALVKNYNVRYLVVAGGAGGGTNYGGGGGAGGYRTLACKSFPVTVGTEYPITIGGGGAGSPHPTNPSPFRGVNGSPTIFSSITSAGGGGGAGYCGAGANGGSGGGGGRSPSSAYSGAGVGNTPPVSPPQGNPGAPTTPNGTGGGGGGAGAAGGPNTAAGVGSATTILGSSPLVPSYGVAPNPSNTGPGQYFAGGGGGYSAGVGGHGGGGTAPNDAGCSNTGGGGSGCAAGGSGIVILRYVTACGPSATGGNANATCGSDTIRVFTSDGTFTA